MSTVTGKESYTGRFLLIGVLILLSLWAVHDPKQFKLGTDLRGGTILVYKIKQEAQQQGMLDLNELTAALKKRLDPDGLKSYQIRSMGSDEVEIIMPAADEKDKDDVKRQISTVGQLRFRVIADKRVHAGIIDLAKRQWPEGGPKRVLIGDQETTVAEFIPYGRWVPADDPEEIAQGKALDWSKGEKRFQVGPSLRFVPTSLIEGYRNQDEPNYLVRDHLGNKYVLARFDDFGLSFDSELNLTREDEFGQRYVLAFNDKWAVVGDYLNRAEAGVDPADGQPIVLFGFNFDGALKFGELTETYKGYKLGIVFDGRLRSAANIISKITTSGQITGFKKEEIDSIVKILLAGKLPVALQTEPERELSIAATLGADTIRNGAISIIISLVAVGAFMIFYYRLAGVVAVFALILNILFTVALMVIIQQTWTLPGLAGLVLTVGMSVDANVLVFERMREELDRGASIPTALRLGYERAWHPILDSNVTSFATAAILYFIGTDQVRGFAVTLTLGILTGMFSALYCTRVVFELLYEKKMIRSFKFMRILANPNYDFIRYMRPVTIASLILIAVGIVAFTLRGKENFDIDFTGGTLAGLRLNKPLETAEVRRIATEAGIQDVGVERITQGSFEYFQFRTTEKETSENSGELRRKFATAFKEYLTPLQLTAGEIKDVGATPPEGDKLLAPFAGGKVTTISVNEPVRLEYLERKFVDGFREANPNVGDPNAMVAIEPIGESSNVMSGGRQGLGYKQFRVAGQGDINGIVKKINDRFAALPEFESFSSFGPQAAGDMQLRAFLAVFLSWCFIIFWVGYRFSNWSFGLGGVAALVHDVLASMGLVAIVSTLAVMVPALEAFFITDMKINLDMVAAILTLIGYSIHDTIVTFDRVRELRGKGTKVTPEMINRAINETLSRTIITSLLTWGSVFVLFLGGGPSLRGFSFLMVVGLVAGTYSTIFIANPVVLWILARQSAGAKSTEAIPTATPAA